MNATNTMPGAPAGAPYISIFHLMARLLVGGVLLYAGFSKAVGPAAEFAAVLEAYKLFPPSLLLPLARSLPYIEMWLGLFVLLGFYTCHAARAAAALFSIFLLALLSALLRGIDLAACGCFGAAQLSPRYTIALDAILILFSIGIYRLARLPQPYSLDSRI